MTHSIPLADPSSFRQCFVCGQDHPNGLRMEYQIAGDGLIGRFTPGDGHQGYPGVTHGSVVYGALDETMGRLATVRGIWMMTGRLEVRYRAPLPIGTAAYVLARIERWNRRAMDASAELRRADTDEVVATATGVFVPLPEPVREEALRRHPDLATWLEPASG